MNQAGVDTILFVGLFYINDGGTDWHAARHKASDSQERRIIGRTYNAGKDDLNVASL